VLLDVEIDDLRDNPLSQFQLTKFSKEQIKHLIGSINVEMKDKSISRDQLDSFFGKFWRDLERDIEQIPGVEVAFDLVIYEEGRPWNRMQVYSPIDEPWRKYIGDILNMYSLEGPHNPNPIQSTNLEDYRVLDIKKGKWVAPLPRMCSQVRTDLIALIHKNAFPQFPDSPYSPYLIAKVLISLMQN
jgi:hypothetical protein